MTTADEVLHRLAALGDAIGPWLAWMNVWTGAIVVAAAAADRLLVRRVSPAWRMALYGAILIRLAMPLGLATPVGLLPPRSDAPIRISLARAAERSNDAAKARQPAEEPTTGLAPTGGPAVPVGAFIAVIWLVGTAALGLAGLRQSWSAAEIRRRSAPLTTGPAPSGPGPGVLVHATAGPRLIGLLRPAIVLPRTLLDSLSPQQVRWVLRHERAHLTRGDHVLVAVIRVLTALLWPIAPLWPAAMRVRGLMEQACDDHVLARQNDRARDEYAGTLLAVATRRPPLAPAPLAFGSRLRSRLVALRRHPRHVRWSLQATLAIGLTGSIALAATTAIAPSQPPQTDAAADEPPAVYLSIKILNTWPGIAALDFHLAQTGEAAPPVLPDVPLINPTRAPENVRFLSPEQMNELLAALKKTPDGRVVAAPAIITGSGRAASIRIGNDGADGTPLDGYLLKITPTRHDGDVTVAADFDEFGAEPEARSLRNASAMIPAGKTAVFLVTGVKGASYRLLCLTPGDPPPNFPAVEPALPPEPGPDALPEVIREYVRLKREAERYQPPLDRAKAAEPLSFPVVRISATACQSASGTLVGTTVGDLGGRALPDNEQVIPGAAVYTLEIGRLHDLFDRLSTNGAARFVKGASPTAMVKPGRESALSIPDPAGPPACDSELTLIADLSGKAADLGPPQGGSLELHGAWTAGLRPIQIPRVTILNMDAASKQMVVVAVLPSGKAADGPARVLVVTAERYGSAEDVPGQTRKP